MKTYKIKTHKGTAKRFKVTGTGKIMRKQMRGRNNAHLKTKRKSARKLMPDRFIISSKGTVRKIKRLLNI